MIAFGDNTDPFRDYSKEINFGETTLDAINGYEKILVNPQDIIENGITKPQIIQDILYQVNKYLLQKKINLACINTSVEASTVADRINLTINDNHFYILLIKL